jgi:hypothetical protein
MLHKYELGRLHLGVRRWLAATDVLYGRGLYPRLLGLLHMGMKEDSCITRPMS